MVCIRVSRGHRHWYEDLSAQSGHRKLTTGDQDTLPMWRDPAKSSTTPRIIFIALEEDSQVLRKCSNWKTVSMKVDHVRLLIDIPCAKRQCCEARTITALLKPRRNEKLEVTWQTHNACNACNSFSLTREIKTSWLRMWRCELCARTTQPRQWYQLRHQSIRLPMKPCWKVCDDCRFALSMF